MPEPLYENIEFIQSPENLVQHVKWKQAWIWADTYRLEYPYVARRIR